LDIILGIAHGRSWNFSMGGRAVFKNRLIPGSRPVGVSMSRHEALIYNISQFEFQHNPEAKT